MLSSVAAQCALVWHWEAPFTQAERKMLREWLEQTHDALERYGGTLPFDVHVYMHRRDDTGEPVPWANTRRNKKQALYFYVDASYSSDDFMADWTAAHEFSHLLLPYLGQANAWFAEGFASYLQYPLMVELGVLSQRDAEARRDRKMSAAVQVLSAAPLSLPDNMPKLKRGGAYPTFYWGGAVYFERVDAALDSRGQSLQSVLRSYVQCCRMDRVDLDGLVATLDVLSKSKVFTAELELMRLTPGVSPRPKPRV